MKATRLAPDTWVFLGLLCLLVLIYSPVLGYATIPTWDDTNFVVHRPEILDWWGVSWTDRLVNPNIGYPIPIPTALYAMLRSITSDYFGLLHGLHVVFHLVNTWLVWRLTRRWLSDPWMAVGTAAVWAFHPALVESVAWLTNTKTLLAGMAILGALNLQEDARAAELSRALGLDEKARGPAFFALALVGLFLLAIGSRPDGAILPWVLGAVWFAREGWKFVRRLPQSLKSWKPESPLWVGTIGLLQVVSLPYVYWASTTHAEVAERKASALSPVLQTLFRMGRAAELSFGSVFWPSQLHPSYFYRGDSGLVEALPGLGLLVLTGVVGFWAWKSGRHVTALGFALFASTYLPYSNLVFLPRLAADTYLYLPTLGLALMVAGLWPNHRQALVVWGFVPVMWAGLTWNQVHRWENAVTLWEPVIAYEPEGDRSYRHVAFAHFSAQNWEAAALAIDAGLPHFTREREIPWYAIEILRMARGPVPAAEVGVRAAMVNVKADPLVQKALVETLLLGKLPMPEAPEARKVILEAFEVYRSNPAWMANPTAGPAIDAYLAQ